MCHPYLRFACRTPQRNSIQTIQLYQTGLNHPAWKVGLTTPFRKPVDDRCQEQMEWPVWEHLICPLFQAVAREASGAIGTAAVLMPLPQLWPASPSGPSPARSRASARRWPATFDLLLLAHLSQRTLPFSSTDASAQRDGRSFLFRGFAVFPTPGSTRLANRVHLPPRGCLVPRSA